MELRACDRECVHFNSYRPACLAKVLYSQERAFSLF